MGLFLIFGVAPKDLYLKVLLYPFKNDLYLPAASVNVGYFQCFHFKVVGLEYEGHLFLAVIIFYALIFLGYCFRLLATSSLMDWSHLRPVDLSTFLDTEALKLRLVFARTTKDESAPSSLNSRAK